MKLRLRKILVWSSLLLIAVIVGAIIFAYTYITDSRNLAALIRAQAPRYFPGSGVKVDHVQLRPLLGQVEITRGTLTQEIDGQPFSTVSLPWIQVRCDVQALWKGKIEPREVMVAQPVLRLMRRSDGSWNLQGLLADPWPNNPDMQPVVRISKGTVELYEEENRALILHDVELTFEPDAPGQFRFEGTAQGDALRHINCSGLLDTVAGRIVFHRFDVTGLTLSDEVRDRLPAETRQVWNELGIAGGELDITVENLEVGRGVAQPSGHSIQLTLRHGAWTCPRLPFPLRDIAATARIVDGMLFVNSAEGRYGKTDVTINSATLDLRVADPLAAAFSIDVRARELELDGRLREQLPDNLRNLWDSFTLAGRDDLGRITLAAHVARRTQNGPLERRVVVDLLDVAACFDAFPFPLEHLRGRMILADDTLEIEKIETVLGPKPLSIKGRISRLTSDPTVSLDIEAGSVPIDEQGALVRALPASVAEMVTQFHPTGTVSGTAHVERTPARTESDPPWGDVKVDAQLDLNEGCSMRWQGLPYPVRRLSGRLTLNPRGCVFSNVRGENSGARIIASGRVDALGADRFAADIRLIVERLRFDPELYNALPAEWQASWRVLNPSGTSRLDAHVVAGWPDRPDRTLLKILVVAPDDEAQVKLVITPAPGTPGIAPGQNIELPAMRGISGEFEFDNGLVTMNRVKFNFREAFVGFNKASMTLRDTGQFDLTIDSLGFTRLRLDAELRRIMPPLMGRFAQKLDENNPLRGQGNLKIAWSGNREEPAVCSWKNVKILLNDAKIFAGNNAIEHIQGELSGVEGRSDGQSLFVKGTLDADSLVVAGVQVAALTTPLVVDSGRATLGDIHARFLDGAVRGQFAMTLADTPEYHGWMHLTDADLARLAQSLPGRQELSGKLSAQLELSGAGADLRQVSGSGNAQLSQADLGKLPWFLKLISPLGLSRDSSAFDSGHVTFVIQDGALDLESIKITGNTISLQGRGTVDAQGEIDLQFTPLAGRDERLHIPGISDLTREASGQVIHITAKGPLGSPKIVATPLPGVQRRMSDMWHRMADGERRRRR